MRFSTFITVRSLLRAAGRVLGQARLCLSRYKASSYWLGEEVQLRYFGLFRLGFFGFGSIETPKLAVSERKRNNRNKRFVSDSAETSSVPFSVVSNRNWFRWTP